MNDQIQTVTGAITPDALGRTLMHEHLVIGYPGWESDTLRPGPTRSEIIAKCVDKIEEMKADGSAAMVDPCPNDLGRDVEVMAEVAQRTGFQCCAPRRRCRGSAAARTPPAGWSTCMTRR